MRKRKVAVVLVCICAVVFVYQYKVDCTRNRDAVLRLGWTDETLEEYEERLKTEASDIEGWTRYDKYAAGLDTSDGSDSDGDGLTDKDEIEIFDSNPLKASTADDLYLDSYKIEHGMDLNTYVEYEGEPVFVNNMHPEVVLEPSCVENLYANVYDCSFSYVVEGQDTIAAYHIYGYEGELSFDLKAMFGENEIPNNLGVIVRSWDDTKFVSTHIKDGKMLVKEPLSRYEEYYVFLVEKSFVNTLYFNTHRKTAFHTKWLTVQSVNAMLKKNGLVVCSPILSELFGTPSIIYCQSNTDGSTDEAFVKEMEVLADNISGTSVNKINQISRDKLIKKYKFLTTIIPAAEYLGEKEMSILQYFLCFSFYENISLKRGIFDTMLSF